MNILNDFESKQVAKLSENKKMPEFQAGDTVKVWVRIVDEDGGRERTQAFEGVCIGRKNAGLNSSFTVRKLSYGEGVERVFPVFSPNINVEVMRRGDVRRAKLYYLRGRTGKSARITERTNRVQATAAAAPAAVETPEAAS